MTSPPRQVLVFVAGGGFSTLHDSCLWSGDSAKAHEERLGRVALQEVVADFASDRRNQFQTRVCQHVSCRRCQVLEILCFWMAWIRRAKLAFGEHWHMYADFLDDEGWDWAEGELLHCVCELFFDQLDEGPDANHVIYM